MFQFLMWKKPCFLSFSTHNHAEPLWNYLKKYLLDPKRAKFNQNSDFGHVQTYSSFHKLRNTQGKLYGTNLGNIYIYMECIRNIHRYSWCRIIRNTGVAFGGAPMGRVCVSDYFKHEYVWRFFIYSLYIPYKFPKYVPYISPCVFHNLWSQE